MILMKGFLFSLCFISLSTNFNFSIDIFIMSKLIKHAMIRHRHVYTRNMSHIKTKTLSLTIKYKTVHYDNATGEIRCDE